MDFRKAKLQELITIRYFDDQATLVDKMAADSEIIRRQRKQRYGKPIRPTSRAVMRR